MKRAVVDVTQSVQFNFGSGCALCGSASTSRCQRVCRCLLIECFGRCAGHGCHSYSWLNTQSEYTPVSHTPPQQISFTDELDPNERVVSMRAVYLGVYLRARGTLSMKVNAISTQTAASGGFIASCGSCEWHRSAAPTSDTSFYVRGGVNTLSVEYAPEETRHIDCDTRTSCSFHCTSYVMLEFCVEPCTWRREKPPIIIICHRLFLALRLAPPNSSPSYVFAW